MWLCEEVSLVYLRAILTSSAWILLDTFFIKFKNICRNLQYYMLATGDLEVEYKFLQMAYNLDGR